MRSPRAGCAWPRPRRSRLSKATNRPNKRDVWITTVAARRCLNRDRARIARRTTRARRCAARTFRWSIFPCSCWPRALPSRPRSARNPARRTPSIRPPHRSTQACRGCCSSSPVGARLVRIARAQSRALSRPEVSLQRHSWFFLFASSVALVLAGTSAAQSSAKVDGELGATLAGVLAFVEARNPELRAMSFEADAAQQRLRSSGALPDPILGMELRDIPISEPTLSPANAGSTKYSLRQMFPLGDKRELRRGIAEAEAGVACAKRS